MPPSFKESSVVNRRVAEFESDLNVGGLPSNAVPSAAIWNKLGSNNYFLWQNVIGAAKISHRYYICALWYRYLHQLHDLLKELIEMKPMPVCNTLYILTLWVTLMTVELKVIYLVYSFTLNIWGIDYDMCGYVCVFVCIVNFHASFQSCVTYGNINSH